MWTDQRGCVARTNLPDSALPALSLSPTRPRFPLSALHQYVHQSGGAHHRNVAVESRGFTPGRAQSGCGCHQSAVAAGSFSRRRRRWRRIWFQSWRERRWQSSDTAFFCVVSFPLLATALNRHSTLVKYFGGVTSLCIRKSSSQRTYTPYYTPARTPAPHRQQLCNHASTTRCSAFRNWLGGSSRGVAAAAAAAAAMAAAGGAARTGGGVASGAAGDAKLLKLGLESTVDRRRVMAVVMKEEPNPSFINWFEVCLDRNASALTSGRSGNVNG